LAVDGMLQELPTRTSSASCGTHKALCMHVGDSYASVFFSSILTSSSSCVMNINLFPTSQHKHQATYTDISHIAHNNNKR